MKISSYCSSIGLVVAGLSSVAMANTPHRAEAGEAHSISVDHHDIDLRTRAGQKALNMRLKLAIRQQCSGVSDWASGSVQAGPGKGQLVTRPSVESPRARCARLVSLEARRYRDALIEAAASRAQAES